MTRPASVRLPASDFRRTPWKNGGGVTIDIADRYRAGAEPGSWAGMVWRFGRTAIVEPAPFSDLSGYDRIIVVVGGRGLVLRRDDGQSIDVRTPYAPVRFGGGWPIRSELEAGPVEVLNLIGDARTTRLDLQILRAGEDIGLGIGEIVAYAPGEACTLMVSESSVEIPGGDAVRLGGDQPLRLSCERGTVAIAWVGGPSDI